MRYFQKLLEGLEKGVTKTKQKCSPVSRNVKHEHHARSNQTPPGKTYWRHSAVTPEPTCCTWEYLASKSYWKGGEYFGRHHILSHSILTCNLSTASRKNCVPIQYAVCMWCFYFVWPTVLFAFHLCQILMPFLPFRFEFGAQESF